MNRPDVNILALHLISGVGVMTYRRLLARFGSPEGVLAAPEDMLLATPGVHRRRLVSILKSRTEAMKKAESEISRAEKRGIDIFDFRQEGYPPALKSIFDPPLVIYVKGRILPEDAVSIAVVGTRRPSMYGERAAGRFAAALARKGFTIVSGLARGIDTAAHNGALEAQGRTIGVMGSGINRPYPAENEGLMERVAEAGAVLSELPLDAPPSRETFPRRNRLISGLSLGTFVIEGAENSGALITARAAVEQGREVFALPGRVDDPRSRGPHLLIKQGAKLVESADDIMEELGPVGDFFRPRPHPPSHKVEEGTSVPPAADDFRERSDGTAARVPLTPLPPAEKKILDLLSDEPSHIDEIISETSLPPQEVAGLLLVLEIKRLVRRLPGNRYVRNAP